MRGNPEKSGKIQKIRGKMRKADEFPEKKIFISYHINPHPITYDFRNKMICASLCNWNKQCTAFVIEEKICKSMFIRYRPHVMTAAVQMNEIYIRYHFYSKFNIQGRPYLLAGLGQIKTVKFLILYAP